MAQARSGKGQAAEYIAEWVLPGLRPAASPPQVGHELEELAVVLLGC